MNVRKNQLSNSLKEKPTKYETIFDHNATEKELGYITNAENKEEYLKEIDYNLDECYLDLYRLYDDKDEKIADKYYSMMSEKSRKEYEKKIDKLMSLMIP